MPTVAGIELAAPGFRRVRIAPPLGRLGRLHAVFPHPAGDLELQGSLMQLWLNCGMNVITMGDMTRLCAMLV
jgi:hypothetical protein